MRRTAIDRLLIGLRRAERVALSSTMLAMVGLYAFNVAVRGLVPAMASRVAWIDEATRFLLVWAVFLGLGLALERGRHVAMTTVLDRLPPRASVLVGRLIDLVGLLFSILVAKLGVDLALFVLASGQISPTLGISTVWLYAFVPVGFALLGFRFLIGLVGLGDRSAARETPVGAG